MKIQNNKTKTATAITTAVILGLILVFPNTVMPTISAQQSIMPANAIRTADGGWITPIRTLDDKGNPLTIHYEVGKDVTGLIAPACATNTGLTQEGGQWTNSTNDNKAIGLQTTWTIPTGTITTNFGQNGIYYNPVNFYYDGPTSGSTPYTFFQVDWGLGGNSLTPPVGQNWYYTLAYLSGGSYQYTQVQMSAPSSTRGSSYLVNGAVEPTNLASPAAYVVQVTLGSNSWIYSTNLGYNPSLDGVYQFQAYQDEYTTKSPGATSLSTNNVASPNVIIDNNGNVGYDPFMLNGLTGFNQNNPSGPGPTYKILSDSQSGVTETDPVSCSTW